MSNPRIFVQFFDWDSVLNSLKHYCKERFSCAIWGTFVKSYSYHLKLCFQFSGLKSVAFFLSLVSRFPCLLSPEIALINIILFMLWFLLLVTALFDEWKMQVWGFSERLSLRLMCAFLYLLVQIAFKADVLHCVHKNPKDSFLGSGPICRQTPFVTFFFLKIGFTGSKAKLASVSRKWIQEMKGNRAKAASRFLSLVSCSVTPSTIVYHQKTPMTLWLLWALHSTMLVNFQWSWPVYYLIVTSHWPQLFHH